MKRLGLFIFSLLLVIVAVHAEDECKELKKEVDEIHKDYEEYKKEGKLDFEDSAEILKDLDEYIEIVKEIRDGKDESQKAKLGASRVVDSLERAKKAVKTNNYDIFISAYSDLDVFARWYYIEECQEDD